MEKWLLFSLISFLLWGTWGFLSKIMTKDIGWKSFTVLAGLGYLLTPLIIYLLFQPTLNFGSIDYLLAILVGILGSFGTFFFYIALEEGKASIVVPLTATYPVVTIILSLLFLKESLTIYQSLAIILIIISIILVSIVI